MRRQLDLFGEEEAKEARRERQREWRDNPQTCPLCGLTEPSGFLLNNNHGWGFGPDFPDEDPRGECTAMRLTQAHLLFWHRADVRDLSGGQLARDLTRCLEVWANHLDELAASLAEHGVDLDALRALHDTTDKEGR